MTDSKVEFVDGLIVKKPNDNAPDFVKCAISIKRSELISWLSTRTEDWINLDVKESKAGKWYAQINDWNPSKQDATAEQNKSTQPNNAIDQDNDFGDIPF